MKKITLAEVMANNARGQTAFALDLYSRLKVRASNLFCSPYSLGLTLAMAGAGARRRTARQMTQILHLPVDAPEMHAALAQGAKELQAAVAGMVWRAAQTLWPQTGYPLQAEFEALLKKYYGASLTALDFKQPAAAQQAINQWIVEQTGAQITELIEPGMLDESTRLVLTNVLYFKGNWACQFKVAATQPRPFYLTPDRTVTVPLMAQCHAFRYAANPTCELLELPYVGERLTMLVLLPRQRGGLADLENMLTPNHLDNWVKQLAELDVEVYLPRFKIGGGFILNEPLIAMGLTEAFNQRLADFTGLGGTLHELYMGAVVHQAWVEVDEAGNETAAAPMAKAAPPRRAPIFRADHPFVFLIRDQHTGTLLSLGHVTNPA